MPARYGQTPFHVKASRARYVTPIQNGPSLETIQRRQKLATAGRALGYLATAGLLIAVVVACYYWRQYNAVRLDETSDAAVVASMDSGRPDLRRVSTAFSASAAPASHTHTHEATKKVVAIDAHGNPSTCILRYTKECDVNVCSRTPRMVQNQ